MEISQIGKQITYPRGIKKMKNLAGIKKKKTKLGGQKKAGWLDNHLRRSSMTVHMRKLFIVSLHHLHRWGRFFLLKLLCNKIPASTYLPEHEKLIPEFIFKANQFAEPKKMGNCSACNSPTNATSAKNNLYSEESIFNIRHSAP